MSIDTGFDPTRPETQAEPSTSLKEEPVPHLDEAGSADPLAPPIDLAAIKEKAGALDQKVRAMIEEHPMRALAVAALAGFLIGRVASRI